MNDEPSTLSAPAPPIANAIPALNQSKTPRSNLHDIRNADLVNRFLAATPPYLYSSPVGPPHFFFSEMLRSFVQTRNNEQNSRFLSNQFRRPRKRLWPQNRCMFDASPSASSSGDMASSPAEKPLELTNKVPSMFSASHKLDASPPTVEKRKNSPEPPKKIARGYSPPNIASAAEPPTLPSSDLAMPSAPPLWYPHLYPPYGIDPLHFFIDLRVSSHVYDRKKENVSPAASDSGNANANASYDSQHLSKRVGSAFSVPSRRDKSPLALNLTSSGSSATDKTTIELIAAAAAATTANNNNSHNNHNHNSTNNNNGNSTDAADDKMTKNTNYVLQNLPRIYTTLSTHGTDDKHSIASDDFEAKSDGEQIDFDGRDNERSSDMSDDVVIVDQDAELYDRKYAKRMDKI